jgi:Fe2+ or Zn2+ uptake regulation protein
LTTLENNVIFVIGSITKKVVIEMEKGSRMTKQRQKILQVIKSTKSHPTADWIYQQVKETMPNISLGTVYRNLGILKEKGEIIELNYGSSHSRYDGNPHPHYHFKCTKCERVFDLEIPVSQQLQNEVMNREGHLVTEHRLEFYGVCKECRN